MKNFTRAVSWPLVFFLLLLLPLLLAVAANAKSTSETLKILSAERYLYDFIGKHTEYDVSNPPPVIYLFKSQKELNSIYYGREATDSDFTVEALYNSSVIVLRDDFEFNRDAYIVLHELVHHLQFHSGANFPCVNEMEREAYDVTDKWVAVSGNGVRTDPLYKALLSCKGDFLYR